MTDVVLYMKAVLMVSLTFFKLLVLLFLLSSGSLVQRLRIIADMFAFSSSGDFCISRYKEYSELYTCRCIVADTAYMTIWDPSVR